MDTTQDIFEICAQEPIRIPGGIQPHGALLVIDPDTHEIRQRTANVKELVGATDLDASAILALIGPELRNWQQTDENAFAQSLKVADRWFHVSAHQSPQGIILEFEPSVSPGVAGSFFDLLLNFTDSLDTLTDVDGVVRAAASEVRGMTGFNRVMIYRFDKDWNGTVIAEDGDGALPSYLDLRFPATDIPAQARALYRQNRLRLIPSARYKPVPLEPVDSPVDGKPLDLSLSALRSVSPVHLEYMRNMGTEASMSISILVDGELWGLISCHHAEARHVPPPTRAACEFLGRIVSQHIASRERALQITQRLDLKRVETELVAHLSRAASFQQGLVERPRPWLGITNADGAAVVVEGLVLTTGQVPGTRVIGDLAQWLKSWASDRVFVTDHLSAEWEGGKAISDVASGVIAVPISRLHASYVMWFRPEVVRTVKWGGDPNKAVQDGDMRVHPRKSFDIWKENLRNRSDPWSEAEFHSASDFRNAVVNFVLQRAEERAALTDELQRSNKELESFSYSISHDLRAPFRHISGYAQLLNEEEPALKEISRHYLEGITNAAVSAGQLVDDLLRFSQLGRTSLNLSKIDMQKIAEETRLSFEPESETRTIDWRIGDLPVGHGDAALIRQTIYNLVDNAVKYTRDRDAAVIEITGSDGPTETRYTVRDNGVGFDMSYSSKLFQVFQRLHHVEDYEGTGIGLALCKRIIDRHGGSISAEGTLGVGATFSFTLPKPRRSEK